MLARCTGQLVTVLALAASVLGGAFSAESAEEYPTRPITLVVLWQAGGPADLVARLLAEELEPLLGEKVVVVNRTGGPGTVGTTFVRNAPADGYTILQVTPGPLITQPLFEDNLPYKMDDFAPLARVYMDPVVALALKDAPWKDLKDFVVDAKANPGKYRWGVAAPRSTIAILAQLFADKAGVQFTHVPYTGGSAAALPDLLGKRLDVILSNFGVLNQHGDKLKALGLFADERGFGAPEVPSIKEMGVDLRIGSGGIPWNGIGVRRDTPRAIQDKLAAALRTVIQSEKFQQRLRAQRLPVSYADPTEFRTQWLDGLRFWREPIAQVKTRK